MPLSLPLCPVAAQFIAPGCWQPSVLVANVLKAQKRCSTSAALLPFLNAADRPPLFIAATPGRSFFTRALSNTPMNRSATASGPAPFTKCTRVRRKATESSSALWLTNGSASSFAVAGAHPLRRTSLPQITSKKPLPLTPIPCPTQHPNCLNNFTQNY